MARKPRRTELEILMDELQQTKDLIESTTQKLNQLKDREKELSDAIVAEETRQILSMMEEKNLSMDELRSLINGYNPTNEEVVEPASEMA